MYRYRDTEHIDITPVTKTGGIVTIDNADDVISIQELVADIEPIQDLNGYDKPWVGGAGKNKLQVTATSRTINGVTFTVNSDGTVKVNGTTTADATFGLGEMTLATNYILNGCPQGGGWNTYVLAVNGGAVDVGTGASGTSISDKGVYIFVKSGQTVNNLVFKPMIRLASETDATYEPYSNICPISGHDSVDTYRTGKNLANISDSENGGINANGNNVTDANNWRSTSLIPIKGGQEYTLHANGMAITRLYFYDASGTFISPRVVSQTDTVTATAPSNAVYAKWTICKTGITSADVQSANVQLELGSTATAYEPYQGTTYTTALGRTVYGGNLEQISGVLTDNLGYVDLGTLTWGRYNNKFTAVLNPEPLRKETGTINMRCSIYATGVYGSSASQGDGTIWLTASTSRNTLYVEDSRYTDAASFKTAMSGVQLVYELATPQTYQLTAQQIDLLAGDNNIWSSGGSVTVTYAIDPELYNGMPTEAVSINGRFLEKMIEGYRTLYTSGRESLEVELGTYGVGTADGEKIKNRRYPSRVLTVGFQLLSDTPEEFRQRFNQLNNILSVEQADFIFADETDKFFTGTPIMDASVEAGRNNVTGEWKIYCAYPFKRSINTVTLSSDDESGVVLGDNSATFTFNYDGVIPSKPLLRCEFASAKSGGDYNEDGDCGFVAFLNPDESIIQLGNPEVIDVDALNKNGTLINSEFDAFTGWTNSGKTIRSISDPYWNSGAGQTQNYAMGAGTLSRSTTGAIGFEFDVVQRLCVSAPTQTGAFKASLKNDNKVVVGYEIVKTGSGTNATVNYILNDTVVGTDSIDISYYNTNFGYCNRTPVYVTEYYQTAVVTYVKKKKKKKKKKTTWVTNTRQVQTGWNYTQSNLNSGISRDGGVVTFSIGELPDRTFKNSDIENTAVYDVVFETSGDFHTDAIRSCAFIAKAGVPFAEIPNVFTAGDIVEADCSDANVYLYRDGSLIGHLEPQYGALGNDWEDFDIKVGQNIIRAVWSDWVNTSYKPTIKIIFNKVYI